MCMGRKHVPTGTQMGIGSPELEFQVVISDPTW